MTKWLAILAAAGTLLAASAAQVALTGRVEAPDGSAAAGALVTARHADGRTVTVYSRSDGGFTLPPEARGAATVEARLPGVGHADLPFPDQGALPTPLRLEAGDPVAPPGSAWLAELPAGEETRRFILDCTGCHVTDGSRVHVDGAPRTTEQWTAALQMMRANFGPGTGFPIISSWADPATLAPWAARHLSPVRPSPQPLRGPAPVSASGAVLTEFPVPVPQDLPHDLMVAEDGTVWITGMFTHQMYLLDPATGDYSTVPIPEPGANPRALDMDADGRIWVVLGGPGKVAVVDPSTREWEIHDVGMYAHSIMVGPDGRGWVNGHFTVDPEEIASVDGTTGEVRRYTVPRPAGLGGDGMPAAPGAAPESTIPYGLRVAPDGTVWGTQLRGNHLLRLEPATGAVEQWALPVTHSGPRRPDVAPDGSIWIPLYSANALARFDPETETFQLWDFPVPGALPYVARVDQRDGTVWIGTGHGDVAASFDPAAERFTLYPLPTRGALVRHLDVDEARGEVWFAYGASPGIPGKLLRLRPGA